MGASRSGGTVTRICKIGTNQSTHHDRHISTATRQQSKLSRKGTQDTRTAASHPGATPLTACLMKLSRWAIRSERTSGSLARGQNPNARGGGGPIRVPIESCGNAPLAGPHYRSDDLPFGRGRTQDAPSSASFVTLRMEIVFAVRSISPVTSTL